MTMLRDKMLSVIADVNAEVAERGELIEAIAIALLTRKNLFILGDTGQAKSYAINLFRQRIVGAKQFERLLSKQCDEEQLFGRLDLPSLISGNPKLITDGKIPDSHIVFLDEIFKANDGILNALLTALNERRFTNEGQTVDLPAISFFSASNEIPNFSDPEERILKPLYDRFELKVVTEYVTERTARLNVLKNKQMGQTGGMRATIALDELYAMQSEVAAVEVPTAVNELMDDILCVLREKKIHISDRKYFGYYPLAQARAWLRGVNAVEASDLTILKCYLWTDPEERAVINPILERMCNDPLKEKLDNILSLALESAESFQQDQGTDPVRRIGKFRSEFVHLYGMALELRDGAQNDAEREQVDGLFTRMNELNQSAYKDVGRECITLPAAYEILKSK